MRFFLEIAFTGTNYKGWQLQPRARSVQAEVNAVLETLFSQKIKSTGCGRTDAGVHARQFYLHFDAELPPVHEFHYKINRMLPPDISVKRIFEVEETARARQDAVSRTYEYFIHFKKDPFLHEQSYHYPLPKPDFEIMQEAAAVLKTFKDFKSLSKTDSVEKTTICNLFFSEWKIVNENRWRYTISANHFLRGQVRLTVGAMLMLGNGKIKMDEFIATMKKKGVFKYNHAVPGCGLSLTKVEYPYI